MEQNFLSNDFSKLHHRKAIVALIVAVLLFGILIVAYLLRPAVKPTAEVAPPPSLTEEEKIQVLIDSTTAPARSTPQSAEELKKLVDSTTAPAPK